MSKDPSDSEPKIIVDEDWKSQVAREKAEQRAKERRAKRDDSGAEETLDENGFPVPSFSMLVSTFATQAFAGMGFIPDPVTNQPKVNRPMAKHFIDMLAVLETKTVGNLTDDENNMLRDALHQLRMAFVAPSPVPPKTAEPANKSTIEIPNQ